VSVRLVLHGGGHGYIVAPDIAGTNSGVQSKVSNCKTFHVNILQIWIMEYSL